MPPIFTSLARLFRFPVPDAGVEEDAALLIEKHRSEGESGRAAWWEARRTAEAARDAGDQASEKHWTRVKWTIARRTGYVHHIDTATRYLEG